MKNKLLIRASDLKKEGKKDENKWCFRSLLSEYFLWT
jgi:hypothetical protein